MDCRSSWSWQNVRVGIIEDIRGGEEQVSKVGCLPLNLQFGGWSFGSLQRVRNDHGMISRGQGQG